MDTCGRFVKDEGIIIIMRIVLTADYEVRTWILQRSMAFDGIIISFSISGVEGLLENGVEVCILNEY
jgi:hypothetical protein